MKTLKRRRKERKTDYRARLGYLKSINPRIVIRKSNKYVVVQYVLSSEAKDSVLIGVESKELLKYGWPKERSGSLKSISASYLSGILLGKKIKEKKAEETVIADFGLQENEPGNRLYAVIKGLVDAGIDIKCKKEMFPEEKRINGEHLKNKINIQEIKNKILK